jgi:hypothetical protein
MGSKSLDSYGPNPDSHSGHTRCVKYYSWDLQMYMITWDRNNIRIFYNMSGNTH